MGIDTPGYFEERWGRSASPLTKMILPHITIRGLSPEVEKKIRQIASDNHMSGNQVLKEIIHKEFGKGKRKPRGASLRELAGGVEPGDG